MKTPKEQGAPFASELVQGFLHMPGGHANCGLVITHGAGGNCNAPLLIAVADALSSLGFAVLRCNLAFRQRRVSGPPLPASSPRDREGLRQALRELRKIASGPLFLGGHSYGGRQGSMLAADEPDVCQGLLLFSYPLHPPNKPEQKRTEHFPRLRVPSLFVHGTKDPFGTIDELMDALTLISAPHELSSIGNAGHDLMRGRFDIDRQVVQPFLRLISNHSALHC